ncbi:MAG: fibronectin type III domain-containing protein [Planctomycetes bacterium]|nr:fibronectin type III domain-containing protein [Planctomycetota bacterium]
MSKPPVFLFYLSLFAIGACGNSPSGSNNSGGGGTPPTIDFAGPTDAAPASYTSIAVQWNAAVVTNPLPGIIYYDVYRAESAGMASEILAATISDGALSMVDSGLADDTTYFYRVLARTDEVASDNADVVSANLPASPHGHGIRNYRGTAVEPPRRYWHLHLPDLSRQQCVHR